MDWELSKLAYKAISLELMKYDSSLLSFIKDDYIYKNIDLGLKVEVNQKGENGVLGVSIANFDDNRRSNVVKKIEDLRQALMSKFSFLENFEYEFCKISPSMIIFNISLSNDTLLPDEVLNIDDILIKAKLLEQNKDNEPYSQRNYADPVINRKMGCLFGLAIGDALGAPVEFKDRGYFEPVTDLRPGGAFEVKAGGWTDDTAMALCLGQSLIDQKGFDPKDQMKKYIKWLDDGYMSAEGYAVGLGCTISNSLQEFRKTGNPFCGSTDPMTAGNGTIMKLAPVPIYYHPDHDAAIDYSVESCKTTHKAQEVLDASSAIASILCHLFDGKDKKTALDMVKGKTFKSEAVSKILNTDFSKVDSENIESTGYVIHTLNSSLWAFMTSSSFEEAVLKAVNLGDDADTTGAVCGQFAGAYWGYSGIPEKWLKKIAKFGSIINIGEKLSRFILPS